MTGNWQLVTGNWWTRQRMHAAYTLIVRIFDRSVPVRYPLDYPDAHRDYYNYDNRTIRLAKGKGERYVLPNLNLIASILT